jgi:hypothetical protein
MSLFYSGDAAMSLFESQIKFLIPRTAGSERYQLCIISSTKEFVVVIILLKINEYRSSYCAYQDDFQSEHGAQKEGGTLRLVSG